MRKIAPIHPDAQKVLGIIADLEKGVVPPVPMAEMRALMKKRTSRLAAEPPAVASIRNLVIEEAGCAVPVRVYHPRSLAAGETVPALIYAHGGGFAVGDLDMVETVCRTICRDAGVAVVSVDYRLSPENKFPAGLDDVDAALAASILLAADRNLEAYQRDAMSAFIVAEQARVARVIASRYSDRDAAFERFRDVVVGPRNGP